LVIHKRIIAISFLMVGVLLCLLVIVLSTQTGPFSELPSSGKFTLIASTFSGVMQITAGYALLKGYRWAHRVSVPVSLLLLAAYPFGTALGLYYLWFRFISKSGKIQTERS